MRTTVTRGKLDATDTVADISDLFERSMQLSLDLLESLSARSISAVDQQ